MRTLAIVTCTMMLGAAALAQDEPPRRPTPGDDLATGVRCAFDPEPNYRYCTDEGDGLQLTDGVYNGCNWTEEGTVGWQVRRDRVFLVDLDLGEPAPIGTVTFDTVTGGAQVTFPAAALVFVSDDGESYRYLGDALTESLPQTQFLNHRFVADDLRGFGRYVRIAVIAGGFFVFCDEIEIMRGEHAAGNAEYLDDGPIAADEVRGYAEALIPWVTQKNATLTLLREAGAAVDAREALVEDGALVQTARETIADGRVMALTERTVAEPDYRRGPPYREPDRAAFAAVARLNAAIWPGAPAIAWTHPDAQWLHVLDGPVGEQPGAEVAVDMMQNEFATASFVLTSCADETVQLDLSAADFTGAATLAAGEVLDIAQVVHVEAFGYNYRDDAIVPAREGPFILQPGVAKRIWLTVRTRGRDVPPGEYATAITVSVAGEVVATVPVRLRVWPLRFPDETTLHSNTWGYFDEGPIVGHEADAARDLVEHYNTALTVNHRYLPRPEPDGEGNLAPMDFAKLSELIDVNPEVRLWLIWPGFEFGFQRLGLSAVGGPAWENAFEQYVTATRDFLASKGIGTDEFAWYWIDEPGPEAWHEAYLPCSRLVKQIDPAMLVWADPTGHMSRADLEAALPWVDFMCPSLGLLSELGGSDVFLQTRLPSWMYVCASEKNMPPFGYYRRHSWKTFSYGLQGIGMWVYTDARAMTLSDYVEGVSYAMVFAGEQGIVGSKRWDAWRQGIADYEYLTMLRRAAGDARAAGRAAEAVARAGAILTEGVAEVVGEDPHGGPPGGAEAADRLRLEVLQCLVDLRE